MAMLLMGGNEMKGARRKAILAAVLALVGAAMTVPMVVSGTASAEAGSRLCGRYWSHEEEKDGKVFREYITRLVEVSKDLHVDAPCDAGLIPFQPDISAFKSEIITQRPPTEWLARGDNSKLIEQCLRKCFNGATCENWMKWTTEDGGLEGMEINFRSDGLWGGVQHDICDNMIRTDVNSTTIYWLHWHNETLDGKTKAMSKVDMFRQQL